jgi:putative addiction module component (TIGR02574 family)
VILEKALALPVEARAALVDSLLESLDTEVDEAVETEWVREVQRRAAELDSGAVAPIPWAEVRSRLHAAVRNETECRDRVVSFLATKEHAARGRGMPRPYKGRCRGRACPARGVEEQITRSRY